MSTTAERLVDDGLEAVEVLGAVYRSLIGVVVPYGRPTDVGLMVEWFDRAAFTGSLVLQRSDVPLLLWHDNRSFPIGHAVAWDDRHDGLWAQFKLALTPVAQVSRTTCQGRIPDRACRLGSRRSARRGAMRRTGILGLGPDHMDHVVRHEARLHEVSLTPAPRHMSGHECSRWNPSH